MGSRNSAVENRDMSRTFDSGDEEGINEDERRSAAVEAAMSGDMIHDRWRAMGRMIAGFVCGALLGGLCYDPMSEVVAELPKWEVRNADMLFHSEVSRCISNFQVIRNKVELKLPLHLLHLGNSTKP